MGYFSENYLFFRFTFEDLNNNGLRRAQLGAIHSIAGHFSNRKEPAIITMPTGSGKTAVLISAAFVLQSKRVLVITPSRLVREQIADEITTFSTLKEAGALPQDLSAPRVLNIRKRITSSEEWEAMSEYDAVIATVQSISPEFENIPEPPNDLFDLVLVDEAHHSPARTWQSVLNHFESAKQILFTATPFRQDQREIKGRFVYTYELQDAFNDGIFGEISFQPVTPRETESHDEAIAKASEQQFLADIEAGYNHKIMVRTDGLIRAKELYEIYQRVTNLRLSIITGKNSLKSVKKIIEELSSGELDGIICVNMLGEGFNFPSLKIAAIHSPHKSLSITLQFVGRFARTGGENLGPATFLAIPSDIVIEAERLYDTRAVWQEIIHNLAALRVNQETETREILQSFSTMASVPDLSDLSLYTLEPYYHVKIYQLESDINIEEEIAFPERLQIAYHGVSIPHNAAVYVTREISLPRWTIDDRLSNIESGLFIFYYDTTTKLLFICASKRTAGLYDEIINSFIEADPRPLPLVRLNKALNDLSATEFFNVGMRNRVASNTTESYRIISGSNADKSVLKSDARLYHRGHAFGRASENGNLVTIGLSSASKIWSNKSSRLPALISWCAKLAEKISSDRIPITHSGLDFLDTGEELEELPNDIIAVDWPTNIYRNPISARFTNVSNIQIQAPLVDFNLQINKDLSTDDSVLIELMYDTLIYRFTFSLLTNRFFEPASENEPEILVEHDRQYVPLIDFINDEMLIFYTSNLSLIDGYNIFRSPQEPPPPYNDQEIHRIEWETNRVNIQCEFGDAGSGKLSIHSYLKVFLQESESSIVYYDHGTGEIADFISFSEHDGHITISLYHCKKSPTVIPGHRLDSIYDLTGQTIKSVTWASKNRILNSIRRRFNNNIGSHEFVKGNLDSLVELLRNATPASIDYEFIAVQPGLKRDGITNEILNMLAATNDHLVRAGFKPLRIMAS
jgi:superfamily II DNA or RNA helicase